MFTIHKKTWITEHAILRKKWVFLSACDFEDLHLESLDGHAKDREEARDDGDDEEAVDQLVLVARGVVIGQQIQDPVQHQAQRH